MVCAGCRFVSSSSSWQIDYIICAHWDPCRLINSERSQTKHCGCFSFFSFLSSAAVIVQHIEARDALEFGTHATILHCQVRWARCLACRCLRPLRGCLPLKSRKAKRSFFSVPCYLGEAPLGPQGLRLRFSQGLLALVTLWDCTASTSSSRRFKVWLSCLIPLWSRLWDKCPGPGQEVGPVSWLQVFAPLVWLLGLYSIKEELETLQRFAFMPCFSVIGHKVSLPVKTNRPMSWL